MNDCERLANAIGMLLVEAAKTFQRLAAEFEKCEADPKERMRLIDDDREILRPQSHKSHYRPPALKVQPRARSTLRCGANRKRTCEFI